MRWLLHVSCLSPAPHRFAGANRPPRHTPPRARACRCKNYPKYNAKDALACFAECGGAAQEIAPACPAIGVLGTSGPTFNGRNYGTATSCCGAPSPHCANTHFDERQHGDWCASSNHVHFDLDYDSAAVLCGTDKPNNCIITKLEPVRCAPART
jgi:hypothetical protein